MKNKLSRIFSHFMNDVIMVLFSTLTVYSIFKIITLFAMRDRGTISFDSSLLFKIYSLQMLPVIIMFGIFIAVIYAMQRRIKNIISALNEKEVQVAREDASREAIQKFTAIMIEFISKQNTEIRIWLDNKQHRGDVLPERVVAASNKISQVLAALSEVSFAIPYGSQACRAEDYEGHLRRRLLQISDR